MNTFSRLPNFSLAIIVIIFFALLLGPNYDSSAETETIESAPELYDETINIAVTDAHERNPVVSLCAGDQYLVVYQKVNSANGDTDIYGQRLYNEGQLLGAPFLISEGSGRAYEPVVACDWTLNRFIVVWTYDFHDDGSDYDVHAQGVWGSHQESGSQLFGTMLFLSDETLHERNASVACNSFENTCLVTYEYGFNPSKIRAQRIKMELSPAGLSFEGAEFLVSITNERGNDPDVAWGGNNDNFLVIWSEWKPASSTDAIQYAVVYDTYHSSGGQFEKGATWLLGWPEDQTTPVAAYNQDIQEYLVVFQYAFSGTDNNVVAYRLSGDGQSVSGFPFYIGDSSQGDVKPAVAFSGGTESLPGGLGLDQFLIPYLFSGITDESVKAQGVSGTYNNNGGQKQGDLLNLDTTGLPGWNFGQVDVVGSINNGHYLVVWEYHEGGIAPDYDILAQRIVPDCYDLYLFPDPGEAGSFLFEQALLPCPSGVVFPYGTYIGVSPNPNEGYTFSHWSGDASGSEVPYWFTLLQDTQITGHFNAPSVEYPIYLPLVIGN